jgi:hypothetical protein
MVFGGIALIPIAIFWPLLFPQALAGASFGEDAIAFAVPVVFLLFGASGFAICWRVTRDFPTRHEDVKTLGLGPLDP